MKKFFFLLFFCAGFASKGVAQDCYVPDLSELEIMCNYENPFNLYEAGLPYTGTWSVSPLGGNIFIYEGYLYYAGASAGQYNLKFVPDNAPATCPAELDFAVEIITTAYVWPVPTYICEGETYLIGDIPLTTEDLHDVYLPGTFCDSLVTIFLLFYDECPYELLPETGTGALEGEEDTIGEVSDPISNDVPDTEIEIDDGGSVEETEEDSSTDEVETPIDVDVPGSFELPDNPIDSKLVFPTAFSPDGNGYNDTFGLVGDLDIRDYSIRIFSRWGNEVFSADDADLRWQGESNGTAVPSGVYYYCTTAITTENVVLKAQGSITLLR